MKILELKGAKVLTKSNQKEITGGITLPLLIDHDPSCRIYRGCFNSCMLRYHDSDICRDECCW